MSYTNPIMFFLSFFEGFFLTFPQNSTHFRRTISTGSSDEESCRASSPISSSLSMYLNYWGLYSTPKAFWFDYLYGRNSVESGVYTEAVLQKGIKPAVDDFT